MRQGIEANSGARVEGRMQLEASEGNYVIPEGLHPCRSLIGILKTTPLDCF